MTESPVTELGATPRRLAELVTTAGDRGLDYAPPDGWSLRMIVAHLLDDEMFDFRLRLERMLSEDRPSFDGFPWTAGQQRGNDAIGELLRDFALQRQASLNMLTGLRNEDLVRTAKLSDGQWTSVSALVDAWVEHDREHLAQGEAVVRDALKQG